MSQSIYTRCPECSTVFRVTEQHLKLAKGRVRCGACLHIFKATEHLVRPKDTAQKSTEQDISNQDNSRDNESNADRSDKSHSMDKLHDLQQQNLQQQNLQQKDSHQPSHREQTTDDDDSHDLLTAPPSAEMDIHYTKKTSPPTQYPIGNYAKDKSEQDSDKSDDEVVSEDALIDDAHSDYSDTANEASPTAYEQPLQDDSLLDESMLDNSLLDNTPHSDEELDSPDTAEPFEPSMDDIDAFVETPDSASNDSQTDTNIDTKIDGPTTPMDTEDESDSSITETEPFAQHAGASQTSHDEFEIDNQQDLNPDSTQPFNTSPLDVDEAAELESDEFESSEPQFDQVSNDDTDAANFQNIDEQFFTEAETEQNRSEQSTDQENEFDHEGFLEQEGSLEPTETSLDDTEAQASSSQQPLKTGLSDHDLEPDPLDEFDEMVTRKQHKYKWLAASGFLLLLLGWGGYTLWTDRQTLAWDDTWGPLVQTLCKAAPCAIEKRRDVSAIELLQRDIRPSDSDPDISDFRLMIQNNATFEQPYPTVEIHFTDTQGKILSTEVHTPDQYLSDELKATQMPSNQKVLILVKAKQPHAQAFGFEFQFK